MCKKQEESKKLKEFYCENCPPIFSKDVDVLDVHIQCVHTGLTRRGFSIDGLLSSIAGKGLLKRSLAPEFLHRSHPSLFGCKVRLFAADAWTINILERRFEKYSRRRVPKQNQCFRR